MFYNSSMNNIKIQCPAKINLNLKIIRKRLDGFHNISSIMQTISLFDYLNIKISENNKNEILINGNSHEIPYDETNLVYKAAKIFLETFDIKNKKIEVYIEKNIPIAAGLAGGSTDAAGILFGLDKVFKPVKQNDNQQKNEHLHKLCTQLGSDLNVCLQGGRIKATGRGEIIEPLQFENFEVSLIKPINLGISAKEAYSKFSHKTADCQNKKSDFLNDLEWSVINDYPQLQYIKQKYPKAVMTGSGSTYFLIGEKFEKESDYWVKNDLHAIDYGVKIFD